MVTTNLAFAEWVTVFAGDEKLTTALLDRLAHHATVITTKGKSYRMRKRRSATHDVERSKTTAQDAPGATIGGPPRVCYPPISRAEEVMTSNRAAVEMTLLWKSQNDFHRSLEISHRTRDSHIPTSRFLFVSEEKNVE